MGCNQSKVEDEESVSRCRRQKKFMKQAIKSRNAFASAHAIYLQTLHTSGTAFRKFAEGEFREQTFLSATPTTPSEILSPLPPAPPELHHSTASSVILPPTTLRNTPLQSETVVLNFPPNVIMSLPSSPNYEQDYFYNDAPPLYLYRSMQQPASSSNFSHDPGSPPFHQPPASDGWDLFHLFEAPTMPIHLHQERKYKEQQEEKIEEEEAHKSEKAVQSPEQEPENVNAVEKAEQIQAKKLDESQQKVELEPKQQQEQEKNEAKLEEATTTEPTSESPVQKLESEEKELTVIIPPKGKDLLEVLRDIQEEFLKASESGRDVSRILEASKVQYHSTFFDSKGLSEHSTRLLSGLSWSSSSPRTPLSWTGTEGSEESTTSEEAGTARSHALTLDRIYAWEKKLYEEVKAVELINIQFEKKRRLLHNLDAQGDDYEKIDKTRGLVKALETQMMVAVQAMEATSASIKKVTDVEMYLQLLELLEGLTNMWKTMSDCHQQQKNALFSMKTTQKFPLESTGISRRQAAIELETALNNWHLIFGTVMSTQKEYIQNLTQWLRLSWLRPEKASKRDLAARKVSRVYNLCRNWQARLEKLPDKPVVDAIKKFSDVIRQIIRQQTEEQRVHKRAESLAKDLSKKILLLTEEEKKIMKPFNGRNESNVSIKSSMSEKREFLEVFKKSVEDEKENFTKAIEKTRALTLQGLQKGLPELFRALSEFATICSKTYQTLLSEVKAGNLEQKYD